jgi:hypothetical protein
MPDTQSSDWMHSTPPPQAPISAPKKAASKPSSDDPGPTGPAEEKPETADERVARRKASFDLSMKQFDERRELAAKHAEAYRGLDRGDDYDVKLAEMKAAHTEERRVLVESQKKARLDSGVDKRGVFVFRGIGLVEQVVMLAHDLAGPAAELDFVVGEPRNFGLDLDVFDPETGITIAVARGAIPSAGQASVLMTAEEVVATVVSARRHQAMTQ